MKQLIQNLKNGNLEIIEVPIPKVSSHTVLIESKCSLISVGTERMLIEFGKGTLLEKIKSQPEKVKEVLEKIKTDGLLTTIDTVFARLEEPIPLGYSNVGIVIEKGKEVEDISIGDRVISNGPHAEIVNVSKNLVSKIPENVDYESASFTVVGSIALESIRLLNPSLGEYIVVIGLGLIGQLTVQLLLSSGCKVLGLDIDKTKVDVAKSFGAEGYILNNQESPVEIALAFSKGRGVDGVIITAATKSNEPLLWSSQMCRKRGRIISVGVTGLNIPRDLFYKKELSLQVSCSYGPGRYDKLYEEKGVDYPIAYVRWTAKRNFEAFLDILSMGKINVKPLITHRYSFDNALKAYETVLKENPLGIILHYGTEENKSEKYTTFLNLNNYKIMPFSNNPVIGFIGVGNFARLVLLPALAKTKVRLKTIASSSGLGAVISGRKYGFEIATSDYLNVLDDPDINTIFIATRHDSHAKLVIEAIKRNKNVFVEKPLALNIEELGEIVKNYKKLNNKVLMVGFNRRFSKFTEKLKELLFNRKDPLCAIVTINAGKVPIEHWTQDINIGGGRIIGEGCHFIDLLRFLVGTEIQEVYALTTKGHSELDEDKISINLRFKDGSIGTIHYFANGNKKYPKERIEVFNEGKIYIINNFRSLECYGMKLKLKSLRQDKGHRKEIDKFIEAIYGRTPIPISFEELIEVTLASFAVVRSANTGIPIRMEDLYKELYEICST